MSESRRSLVLMLVLLAASMTYIACGGGGGGQSDAGVRDGSMDAAPDVALSGL